MYEGVKSVHELTKPVIHGEYDSEKVRKAALEQILCTNFFNYVEKEWEQTLHLLPVF